MVKRVGCLLKVQVVFLLVLVIGSSVGLAFSKSTQKPEVSGLMKYGVNYYSTHNHYEPKYLTDEVLDRDFSLFSRQDIRYVTLALIWKYLEPSLGEYNDAALNDVIRVCSFASKYHLKVIINFYTNMQEDTFTMPEWLSPRKFEQVFREAIVREAWLNFLDHCAERLNSSESIWSWHMMNEPARRAWACDVSIEDFLLLWTEMRTIFKSYSDRPVSIRFAAQVLNDPNHFNRDPRIYELLDYVALNWYEDHCSREKLATLVKEGKQYTRIMISEFGFRTDDDQLQTAKYSEYISLFRNIGVKDCVAWMWRADYDSPNPEPAGTGFNLAKNVQGEPRPAFYLLKSK